MTTVTLQQAFETCQTNKNTWQKLKAELADLEREYCEQLLAGDEQNPAQNAGFARQYRCEKMGD